MIEINELNKDKSNYLSVIMTVIKIQNPHNKIIMRVFCTRDGT